MPFAIRDLGDGRLLIVGAVPGDGLLAAVNALRGDLEHAIIVDRKELIDGLSGRPIEALGFTPPEPLGYAASGAETAGVPGERSGEPQQQGETVQASEASAGPQDGETQQLPAASDEADRRRQILGF